MGSKLVNGPGIQCKHIDSAIMNFKSQNLACGNDGKIIDIFRFEFETKNFFRKFVIVTKVSHLIISCVFDLWPKKCARAGGPWLIAAPP